MNTYIAFLRGINVSGKNKIPMATLREVLASTGLEQVQTYIQSGNVIFQSSEDNIEGLENKIHQAIKNHFTFEIPVLVKTPKLLQELFDACPFSQDKKENSYFILLFDVPTSENIAEVSEISYPNETFFITDYCVYFHSAVGYGRAKCNNNFFERKLKITATARNYKTMVKLLELCKQTGA
ncbi:DUF1697 domain-containing protein [Tamlana sp. 2_MG-2023]|uniref:DUF1697 domain-containing protein n=1 Tax=unclassified Tamlana TaxID=2614803 RepID=UPI0026E19E7E|nr:MULTISPECIES: DUF1697 domain-containing protein [unclassified Tamlana]MDO6760945.1 DUF1697 domain-containing protein [Tamlana sp. 2_MG-2023]MDO6791201.1 DUF1697 domain-containing protein [Tamlana sp. 1_MG-2023]